MNPDTVERWMRHALALAERGRGSVEPNPLVGAVVLDAAGNFAGDGWHQLYGGPHAEVFALAVAGEKAHGGTLIVTLEPCCHHGKTPPCTDAVVTAGIRRVVVAMADPNPQVAGGGLQKLRDTGIAVEVGLCEEEASRLNAPFLRLVGIGRPWVHVKWAMTLDGKIATRDRESKWITGEESRRKVHELRGRMDAIVVGRGTLLADDPMLTARPAGPRVATRVVVTASGKFPETCRLLETVKEAPVLVYTFAPAATLAKWTQAGAEVISYPNRESEIPIAMILHDMGQRGFTNVLVEGGAELIGSFLDARAADEFHVFVAPKVVGGLLALSPAGGAGVARLADAMRLTRFTAEAYGEDVYLHGFAEKTE